MRKEARLLKKAESRSRRSVNKSDDVINYEQNSGENTTAIIHLMNQMEILKPARKATKETPK